MTTRPDIGFNKRSIFLRKIVKRLSTVTDLQIDEYNIQHPVTEQNPLAWITIDGTRTSVLDMDILLDSENLGFYKISDFYVPYPTKIRLEVPESNKIYRVFNQGEALIWPRNSYFATIPCTNLHLLWVAYLKGISVENNAGEDQMILDLEVVGDLAHELTPSISAL